MSVFRMRVSTLRGGDTLRDTIPQTATAWTLGPIEPRWEFGPIDPVTVTLGPIGVRWEFGPISARVGQLNLI